MIVEVQLPAANLSIMGHNVHLHAWFPQLLALRDSCCSGVSGVCVEGAAMRKPAQV